MHNQLFVQGLLTRGSLTVAGMPSSVRFKDSSDEGRRFCQVLQDTQGRQRQQGCPSG
jgi:hypothetical protein